MQGPRDGLGARDARVARDARDAKDAAGMRDAHSDRCRNTGDAGRDVGDARDTRVFQPKLDQIFLPWQLPRLC